MNNTNIQLHHGSHDIRAYPYFLVTLLWLASSSWLLYAYLEPGNTRFLTGAILDLLFFTGLGSLLLHQARRCVIITRAESENIQRERDEKLRLAHLLDAVTSSSPDAIWAKDEHGCYILANPRACEYMAKTQEEVLGRTDAELFPEKADRRDDADDKLVVSSHSGVAYERVVESERGPVILWLKKAPLRCKIVGILGVLAIARDITQRKRSEQAMQESRRRYQVLFENSLNGVAYCQMVPVTGDIPDFQYLEVNAKFEELTGLAAREVIGRTCSEIFPQMHAANVEFLSLCHRVASSGVTERQEVWIPPLRRWFDFSVFSVEQDYFYLTFDDITERRDHEAEILRLNARLNHRVTEQTSQLEEASQDLETLVHSVAANLQEPLRAIHTDLQPLFEKAAGDVVCLEQLDLVVQNAEKMDVFLESTMSYIYTSSLPLSIKFIALEELAQHLVAELQLEYPRAIFRIERLPRLTVAPLLVRAMLRELLINACKFSNHRPVPQISIGCLKGDSEPVLWVKDNGIGFDPDTHQAQSLFSLFHRLHPEHPAPGVGVGLALVRRLAARHGGRVWAESAEEAGATFFVAVGPPPMDDN